jgi:hypothetical protein
LRIGGAGGGEPVEASLSVDVLTFLRPGGGVSPSVEVDVSSTGTITGPLTLYWATRSGATPLTKSEIENGTGAAVDHGTITGASIVDLDGTLALTTSVTDGALDVFVRDSAAVESDVASETGVTFDAAAPVVSAAEVGDIDDTSLIVTLDKAVWGTTSAAAWAVEVDGSPITISSLAFTPGGTTIDFTVAPATPIIGQDTVTVSYSGSTLVGEDSAQIATFTDAAVTNNTAAGIVLPYTEDYDGLAVDDPITDRPAWSQLTDPNLNNVVQWFFLGSGQSRFRNQSATGVNASVFRFEQPTLADSAAEVKIDARALGSGVGQIEIYLRSDGTRDNGYLLRFVMSTGTVTLRKRVAGVDSALGTSSPGYADADTFRLECEGTAIRAVRIRSGTPQTLINVTDAQFSAGGFPLLLARVDEINRNFTISDITVENL